MNAPATGVPRALGHAFSSSVFTKEVDAITKAVADYLQLGVAVLRHEYPTKKDGALFASTTTMRKVLRRIARERRVPFVYVEQAMVNYGSGGPVKYPPTLVIQNLAKTRPMTTRFLLIAEKCSRYNRSSADITYEGRSTLKFTFRTKEAQQMLDQWLDSCRTDPVIKKILGTDKPLLLPQR